MKSFLPEVMAQMSAREGTLPLLAAAALRDRNGDVTNCTWLGKGFIKAIDFDEWKATEMAEVTFNFCLDEAELSIGGQQIFRADPFGVSFGGIDQSASVRAALLTT